MSCNCEDLALSNLGIARCKLVSEVAKKLIFVSIYQADGTRNQIDLDADTINDTYVSAKVNHADGDKRWYFSPELKDAKFPISDPTYKTWGDGTKALVQPGVRSFSAAFDRAPMAFFERLSSMGCHDIGVYVVDKKGNLIGSNAATGYLRPIPLDTDSYYAALMMPEDTEVQNVTVMFDIHRLDKDVKWRMIGEGSMPADLLDYEGLLDVYSSYDDISQTGFTAMLYHTDGDVQNPIPVAKLVTGDFALYNTTTSAAVTILTMTENPDGTYAFTFASQTLGNKIRITPSQDGMDFQPVIDNLVTITS